MAVKEVAWNQPITSVIQLSVTLTTKVTATARVPTTIHRYIKPNFLPYVLVALSVTAVLIIAFALFRRRHLRKLRILPQSISNNTEEELTTFVLKSSKTDNSSHTAPTEIKIFTNILCLVLRVEKGGSWNRLIIKILLCLVTNLSINHKKEYTHGVQATKRFSKCSATRKIPITVTEMRTF